ncbi:MAG: N-acetylglucosamine kinase [Thermoproteota archaeon]
MTDYVLGLDGGATRTRCVVATLSGEILAIGISGPSNYHVVGIDGAREALKKAAQAAFDGSNVSSKDCLVACAGLAGLDCSYDVRTLNNALRNLPIARRIVIVHDSLIALYGATGGKSGVIVNGGTGSMAAGMDSSGRTVRVGGWGSIVGDEGSAYDIGRRAITAALWAFDGRGPETILMEKIRKHYGLTSIDDIIHKVYVEKIGVTEIASLAPLVTESVKEGDKVSQEILRIAGEELGRHAVAVIKKLGMEGERCEVALVGGVLNAGELVLAPMRNTISKVAPKAVLVSPRFNATIGAVLIALREVGCKLDESLLNKISESARRLSLL